ncbi:MAG: E3 ubiquitin--protein ligase [Nitrosomonas sp.]|nr:E3 ubiquitin--protein ligase [Nitrosomonas sp.]MBK7363509.1 E3 ubiquitin--protein ligase [Nitrosomonas sp.]
MGVILIDLISFYSFFKNWKRLRFIEDTPTARLRSSHQGYVEIEGKGAMIADKPIYAPLSNHPCLWYRSQIECKEILIEKEQSQIHWNVIYSNISRHSFKLTDGSTSCFVDPDSAEIQGEEKLVWYGNTEWPNQTQILESQSVLHSNNNRYRYSESLILPGQPLYVLGQFSTSSAASQYSIREIMSDLILDWKKDSQHLLKRFDTNKDGQIDQQEWEFARHIASTESQQIYQQRLLEPEQNIITKPKDKRYPFIISVYSQTSLRQKYRRTAYLSLLVCLILTGYIIWLTHTHG